MRRSASVVAPLLAATAVVLLSGCKQTEMERCVDEQSRVVDQSLCKNLPQNGSQTLAGTPTTTSSAYVPHHYHHYYGGAGGYALGSLVTGGSYSPVTGHSYSTTAGRSSTSRGGFGSSFSSSSS